MTKNLTNYFTLQILQLEIDSTVFNIGSNFTCILVSLLAGDRNLWIQAIKLWFSFGVVLFFCFYMGQFGMVYFYWR